MMDFSKLKNSKILKITAIIALPTILVASYYGYKYIKRKSDEKKIRNKYKTINSVAEFLEAINYLGKDESIHLGYDIKLLKDKKEALDKLEIDKVKRLYELIKISTIKQTPAEQDELLGIIKLIYT
jgi:hypothetical protein